MAHMEEHLELAQGLRYNVPLKQGGNCDTGSGMCAEYRVSVIKKNMVIIGTNLYLLKITF